MNSPPGPSSPTALAFRDFRFFIAARFLFTIGTQMQSVAIGWQVYEKTRQPLDLGFVGLAEFLPRFFFAFVSGYAADRYDRRLISMLCIGVQAISSVLFIVVTRDPDFAVGWMYAIAALMGTAYAFSGPANQSLVPRLVPPGRLPQAVAINSAVWELAAIAGPGVGGLIYGAFDSAHAVYATDTAMAIGALTLMSRVRTRTANASPKAMSADTLMAGLRFVWRKKPVLGSISLDMFAVLLGGSVALLPAYARDIMHVGPEELGFLRASPAIGAAIMAAVLARLPPLQHAGRAMFGGVAVFGLATIAFGLSGDFRWSCAILAVMGAADMVSVVVRQTLVQTLTPDHMRGRVSAVNFVFIGASNQLGEFESGVTAEFMGLVPAVVFGGIGTLVVTVLWIRWFPALWHFGTLAGIHPSSPGDPAPETMDTPPAPAIAGAAPGGPRAPEKP